MTPKRVIVFCDWQNIYRRAREANFSDSGSPSDVGQVVPLDLGELLAERGPAGEERVLEQVRIYRGIPKQERDQRGYDAVRSQHGSWSHNRKIEIVPGRITYPADWSPGKHGGDQPREKGVDVALAIDVVTMAIEGKYDVAIVFSCDNDLLPAVEFVASRHSLDPALPKVEVAAWKGIQTDRRPSRLNPAGFNVWCHWLRQEDYWRTHDPNRYPLPHPVSTGGRPKPAPPRRF